MYPFLILMLCWNISAWANGNLEESLAQNTYLRAKRILEKSVQVNEVNKSSDWVQSLLALVYLQRLSGEESEAKKNFFRCNKKCLEYLNKNQWNELKTWACRITTHTKISLPKACTWYK